LSVLSVAAAARPLHIFVLSVAIAGLQASIRSPLPALEKPDTAREMQQSIKFESK
jgi:hypothetical protein